jgi:molecular chaperone DnaJ
MTAVNEAYRVLSEPGRRAVYDRALLSAGSTVSDTAPDRDDDLVRPDSTAVVGPHSRLFPEGPARVPWKLMLIAAAVGSALVLITAMFNDLPAQEPPDGILRAGSCIEIEASGDAREIACTNSPADVVVSLLLPTGATCPAQMAAHRDRLGLGTVCIPFD